ncbi:MAG: CHAT domain-containing protein [Caldilineaceae bacterium]|nr:CHAT domain-containing protein [Caldilineaceae bacterium]
MSNTQPGGLIPSLLVQLDTDDTGLALALLRSHDLATPETALQLVNVALERAESSPRSAARWLAIASALDPHTDPHNSLQAQIHYAHARVYLQSGELHKAEASLHAAQDAWQALEDRRSLARSYLGMTQILALQGRFDEAERAIHRAIDHLPPRTPQLAWAYSNLANLLDRRGDYETAVRTYDHARALLVALKGEAPLEAHAEFDGEIAEVDLNRANVLVALDRPQEAEEGYLRALAHFKQREDPLIQGRIESNLGSLYLRTGQYAQAMESFYCAESLLLGEMLLVEPVDVAQLRQADMLLLDQANAYLALNLLSEAASTLERCQSLFRAAVQPYELAQSLYALGLIHLRQDDVAAARLCLLEAQNLFAALHNHPWANRTELALAMLDERIQDQHSAATRLDQLLDSLTRQTTQGEPSTRDLSTTVEAQLLRLQIWLNEEQIASAQQMADQIERILARSLPLPHLRLRLAYARGNIELAQGEFDAARRHFYEALRLIEDQRMSLPIEEFRTAYLADKFHIHSSLVLSLLHHEEEASKDQIAEAFAVIERARARSLLERLQTTLPDHNRSQAPSFVPQSKDELYQKLHWLYNSILGEGMPNPTSAQAVRTYESLLERFTWKSSQALETVADPLLAQTQPVSLAQFQANLAEDQQALFYYIVQPGGQGQPHADAEGEVMLFLMDRKDVRVFRHLCTADELARAQAEFQFQLGRAELGADYLARHRARFEAALYAALGKLYDLLIRPAADHLCAPRFLLAPYGSLHRVPFHALWDGERYLLERFTCSYVPSASVAVHTARISHPRQPYHTLAGLALDDPAIPHARREVEVVARHFQQSWLYLEEKADRNGLTCAAAQADILHIATHGIFRPDNPFFSSLKLADGWIDVRSLYQLPLSARLVILNACESGSGWVQGGDEVIGLARGFLGAGAHNLVVSLWNVYDARAVDFMSNFYERLTVGMDAAAALRAAQRAAVAAGDHPYYWASFFAIGV